MKIPQPEIVDVEQLKVDQCNPNIMSKNQLERLKTSIQQFGFIVPIITNREYLIADGEQRLNAAKQLGFKQVSVIRLDVADVDRRLLRQVLNKLRGEHDLIADALEFERIIADDRKEDLKLLLALSDSQLERYQSAIHEPTDETYEMPAIEKITTSIVRGDMYLLGKHKLMCGDATNKEDINQLLNSAYPSMIFVDPPYGVQYDKHYLAHTKEALTASVKSGKSSTGFKYWGKLECDVISTTLDFIEAMKDYAQNCSWYICCAGRFIHKIKAKLDECHIYCATPLVWVKANFVMSWERYHAQHEHIFFCGDGAYPTGKKSRWYGPTNETTVWQIPIEKTQNLIHPTMKPVELVVRAIRNSSQVGDIVYDGFGGSGTTLIACEQTGRTCYMMEIEPRYVQIIIDRWQAFTHKKAEKIGE